MSTESTGLVNAETVEDVLMQLDRYDFAESAWLLAGEIARLRGLVGQRDSDGDVIDPGTLGTADLYGPSGDGDEPLDRLCRAHHLATVGVHVMHLDGEDFADLGLSRWTPQRIATVLLQASWPQHAGQRRRGALTSLAPTMRLLLEQVDVRGERRDFPELLAVLHLISDYLPLLAWEAYIAAPGDPRNLIARLDETRVEWGQDGRCKQGKELVDLRKALTSSSQNPYRWKNYLATHHTRAATVLAFCAGSSDLEASGRKGCQHQCAMAPPEGDERRQLAHRMAVARHFGSTPIIMHRHSSPVGHFFSVPDARQIRNAWQRTCVALSDKVAPWEGLARFTATGDGYLPGLADVVGYAAGIDTMRPAHVVTDLIDGIRDELDPLDV